MTRFVFFTEAAIVGQRFLRVALSVAEAYQARKARAGVVDFQDLLVLARDLLRDRPEVRASLQKRLHVNDRDTFDVEGGNDLERT